MFTKQIKNHFTATATGLVISAKKDYILNNKYPRSRHKSNHIIPLRIIICVGWAVQFCSCMYTKNRQS